MIRRYRPNEAWVTTDDKVLLVRGRGDRYKAFIRADMYVDMSGYLLERSPFFAPDITNARAQLLEAKRKSL